MRKLLILAAFLAAPAAAQSDTAAASISQERLRQDLEALVSFGTHHTLSERDSSRRGIGAGESEFRKTSEECGGCLEIVLPERMVEGDRIPEPVRLVNVVAIQRGTERPNEVVIVQAHMDSRASDVMDATSDAPGANDNASGRTLVLEAARALSDLTHPSTIVYALLSGEEQGLYVGELLADYAEEQGWTVKAVLNNDIVGNSCGSAGDCDPEHVRVFSEGPRADADERARAAMRRDVGENDSPGRNLSRFITQDGAGRRPDSVPEKWLSRGALPVAVEDYEHQHQDLRAEDGITYGDTVDEMVFDYSPT